MITMHDEAVRRVLTPYRVSRPVLEASGTPGAFDACAVDIPFVFWHRERFYMLYTGYDGKGYQSALAVSGNLLQWHPLGVILPRDENSGRWDAVGCAGTWILKENNELRGIPRLKKVDGKYWLVYHSYPQTGYEEGPAEIGLAWCEDEELLQWHRLDTPVFSWRDGAAWEAGGLYKACLLWHEGRYWMYYNAKDRGHRWIEQTGLAWSADMRNWERCADNPILRVSPQGWDSRFVSDPCIVHDGSLWYNFFFGFGSPHAMDGLAISRDMVHWEKLSEPILPSGKPGDLDEGHAHKASVVFHNGVLYHFYCATRPWREGDRSKIYSEYRTIAVATSHPVSV